MLRRVALVRTDILEECSASISPWWGCRYVSSKRWFLQEPHGVTCQKTAFFTHLLGSNMQVAPKRLLHIHQDTRHHTAEGNTTSDLCFIKNAFGNYYLSWAFFTRLEKKEGKPFIRRRFEVFTAVTMKNSVFWYIKPSSYHTWDTLRLRYRAQPVKAMYDLLFSRR
jgi:hypothetical protein